MMTYLDQHRKCGSHISNDALVAAEEHFAANAVSKAEFSRLTPTASNTSIPVYFHIISGDSTPEGGTIS